MEYQIKDDLIKTRVAKIWKENDWLFVVFDEFSDVGAEDLVEMQELTRDLWAGSSIKLLSDMRGMSSMSKAARRFVSNEESEWENAIVANAVIVDGSVSRIIGNLIMKIDRPPFPFKIFGKPEKAMMWLHQQ